MQQTKAKAVLKWRAEKPEESGKIWSQLADVNEKINTTFREISLIAQVSWWIEWEEAKGEWKGIEIDIHLGGGKCRETGRQGARERKKQRERERERGRDREREIEKEREGEIEKEREWFEWLGGINFGRREPVTEKSGWDEERWDGTEERIKRGEEKRREERRREKKTTE